MQAFIILISCDLLNVIAPTAFRQSGFFFTSNLYAMKQCVVRIGVSSATNYAHIDDVVYYRSGMSPDFVQRWRWFFDYLAALVKVANPRRRVEVWSGPVDIMLGDEWHQHGRAALLKSRTIKLKQLRNFTPRDDLFGFAMADHERHVGKVQKQIELLERDEFPIADFPEYINKIKDYI